MYIQNCLAKEEYALVLKQKKKKMKPKCCSQGE